MTDYRNWTIEYCPYQKGYEAVSNDYEPIWLGEDFGWLDGERFAADTLESAMQEIDERIAEQAEYQRDCAADADHDRRAYEGA